MDTITVILESSHCQFSSEAIVIDMFTVKILFKHGVMVTEWMDMDGLTGHVIDLFKKAYT